MQSEEQPRETNSCNSDEENELRDHSTQSSDIPIQFDAFAKDNWDIQNHNFVLYSKER